MTLDSWINKYGTHEVMPIDDSKACLDELKESLLKEKIYIYGAGAVGKTLVRLFNEVEIIVECAFDRDYQNRKIDGVKVLPPDDLNNVADGILIIAGNWRNQESIRQYLMNMNIMLPIYDGSLIHAPLQRSICIEKNKAGVRLKYEECTFCFIEKNSCDLLRENLIRCKPDIKRNNGMSILPQIEIILGNQCSLRCKDCAEAIPYNILERKFEPKEKIIDSIGKMAEAIDFVNVVDFVGGEPFLHPELPEIIEYVRNISNVGLITIFTNGTVIPSQELIDVLKHEYIIVNIADYSKQLNEVQIENINRTESVLKGNGIQFVKVENMTWFDMSSYEKNDDTKDDLARRFHNCRMNSCYRLFDGKLFRCLHMYAGYVSGKLPLDEKIVYINDYDAKELAIKLDEFWNVPYSTACNYCELPYISRLVPSGVQVKEVKSEKLV